MYYLFILFYLFIAELLIGEEYRASLIISILQVGIQPLVLVTQPIVDLVHILTGGGQFEAGPSSKTVYNLSSSIDNFLNT